MQSRFSLLMGTHYEHKIAALFKLKTPILQLITIFFIYF